MKFRNGFVSNSSSSSFVIGLGFVKDEEKVEKLKSYEMDIVALSDVITEDSYRHGWGPRYNPDNDTLTVESFMYSTVVLPGLYKEWVKNPTGKVAILEATGGDDSDFAVLDDDGSYMDMNYDIDESFFDGKEEANLIALFDSGAIDGSYDYGAGRNG